MIVYGDPTRQQTVRTCVERVRAGLGGNLDALRDSLIAAGELEQAVADGPGRDRPALLRQVERVTDLVAAAFLGHGSAKEAYGALDDVGRALGGTPLTIHVPEGFAFYTLYPEQYRDAAERWAADHGDERGKQVLVLGVRSIGTTLSAVVAGALRGLGWRVKRITVRPGGHPFQRELRIERAEIGEAQLGLVVDEGPGLSGSSMAAVARAMTAAGIHRGRISFMPGHGNGPGAQASPDVRQWWDQTRSYVVGLEEMRWEGRRLQDVLSARTREACGGEVLHVEDWADVPIPAELPHFGAFARTKFRCILADGRAVAWKFMGLGGGTEAAAERLSQLAATGWTEGPLGVALGFVGVPWVDGKIIGQSEADDSFIAHAGRYIAAAAGQLMPADEQQSAIQRLKEMAYWNVKETLGDEAAEVVKGCAAAEIGPASSYGDGRTGPGEWIRTPTGTFVKVNCVGHDVDHTIVGRQAAWWDVAGAIVEWGLDERQSGVLIRSGGFQVPVGVLRFYRMAYAAFRVAMCATCEATADAGEGEKLRRAGASYRDELKRALTDR
jgi:hypothetical protein